MWIVCSGWSQETPASANPRVNVGTGSGPAFVSGTWGGIQLALSNPRKEPAELLCLTYLGSDATLQFGRRTWVPPQARLRTWQPIRLPPAGESKLASVDYHTLLSEVSSSSEVLLPDSVGRLVRDGALPLGTRGKVTGFIDTKELSATGEFPSDSVNDLVLAARSQTALSLRTSYFYESPLPFYGPESLEALDCLVIADSRILGEPMALAAVRRWLFQGGRLWILLDQVDPQVLEALLGDQFACQVVDRVGLTQVKIDAGAAGAIVPQEGAEFEQPVDLVRVVASEIDVMYTVQGWPAALLKRFGDGQLLVTTLAPDGWLRTARPRDRTLPPAMSAALAGPLPPQGREGVAALRNVAADFFSEPLPPLLPPAALQPIVREYIGYRIPPAGIVIGLLGVFNVVLIGAGLALWRAGRLDRIGYVIPLAALSVALLLVFVGRSYRRGITPTAARLQMVQLMPGTDDQRAWGVAGLASESTLPAEIATTHGGWAELNLPPGATATRRMVWTDHETWRWENLRQPAGLQLATYQTSTTVVPRVAATAKLSAEGLAGTLTLGGQGPAEDCMIVTRDGRISVNLKDDGTFLAPANGVMGHRQFLSAGLLTDEQNRRQRVLAEVLTGPRQADFPDRPHLFFWSNSWDAGIDFGSQLRPVASTLVAVPLELARPAAGTEVVIPAPLISFRSVRGPDGTVAGGMYEQRQRQWLERSRPSRVWLEFQVPTVLLPLETTSARVVFEVNGPMKQLEVAALHEGQAIPLAAWRNPVGTLTADLTEPQHLALSPKGTLLLRVAAGGEAVADDFDPAITPDGRVSYWRIESLRLELRGRVLSDNDPSLPSSAPSP
jgi:hypothetical protein